MKSKPRGSSGKMSQVYSLLSAPVMTRQSRWKVVNGKWKRVAILKPFYANLRSGGIIEEVGAYSTLNTSVFPNDESGFLACSLASILQPDAPRKYWLSPKACAGILRRVAKRKRKLPAQLLVA